MWILKYSHDREDWATYQFWYFIFQMTFRAGKVKWVKALRMDPKLRRWAIEEMRLWLAEGIVFMEMHKKTLEALEMEGEPDWNKLTSDLRYSFKKLEKYYLELFGEDLKLGEDEFAELLKERQKT